MFALAYIYDTIYDMITEQKLKNGERESKSKTVEPIGLEEPVRILVSSGLKTEDNKKASIR